MDFPTLTNQELTPTHISSYALNFCGGEARPAQVVNLTIASTAWAAANLAEFYPFFITHPYTVERVYWTNGSSVGHAVSAGIYTWDGVRLDTTGAITSSGASALQYNTLTNGDLWLPPGSYYFGFSCAGTTNAVGSTAAVTAVTKRFIGILQQTSAHPIPTTMASAAASANTGYPLVGITRLNTGF